MKNGFLQGANGNNSNSRLIADVVIFVALLFAGFILHVGSKMSTPDVMQIATSAGVVFTTIAGPALLFLFAQKKTENDEMKNNPV